jgi:hypothetical protein
LSAFFLPIKPEYPCARLKNSTCRQVGAETLEGRPTQIWNVTLDFGGPTWTFKEWVDLRLHAVIKRQIGDRVTYLSNIVEAPQPESLFELAVRPTR